MPKQRLHIIRGNTDRLTQPWKRCTGRRSTCSSNNCRHSNKYQCNRTEFRRARKHKNRQRVHAMTRHRHLTRAQGQPGDGPSDSGGRVMETQMKKSDPLSTPSASAYILVRSSSSVTSFIYRLQNHTDATTAGTSQCPVMVKVAGFDVCHRCIELL
jgi:hypothetical protein